MMSTDSNHLSENSHQGSPSAEAPQYAATEDDWPGATPPAGWFLRSPANGQAASPPRTVPVLAPTQASPTQPCWAQASPTQVTGAWVASLAPESDESPISWYEGMDDPGPEAEPPVAVADELPEPPVAPVTPIAPVTPATARTGPRQRPVLAAPPVVSPTRALRGGPGGPGFQPKRPAPGAKR